MPDLASLERGQRATIIEVPIDAVPLKLLEMGCLPGNEVRLVQVAPYNDPLYLDINGTHLAIRREMARHILVDLIS